MGVVAYVFPLLLLAGFMFYGLIRRTRFAGRKMLGLLLTFIFVCAFAEILFSRESIVAVNPMTVYENSAAGHKGGGLLGGTVTFLFSSVFGYIGTLVLTSFGFIISLIIMTQKPLFTVLGRKGRDEAIRLRERRQIRREKKEEEIRREEEHREMIRREERRARPAAKKRAGNQGYDRLSRARAYGCGDSRLSQKSGFQREEKCRPFRLLGHAFLPEKACGR